jgi:HlyD family secretion protein
VKAERRILVLGFLALTLSSCTEGERGIVGSGTIEAVDVNVSSKVDGEVVEMIAEEGQTVQKGDVLVRIDHTLPDLQLQKAQAGVRLAEAQLQLLLKGARVEDIGQAEEALAQAQENLRLAKEDNQRIQNLYQSGSATTKQRDEADARLKVAQSRYNSASQALKKLQNLARPEEIEVARAVLDQARLVVRIAEEQIRDATVVAPISGTVTQRLVEPGETVGKGMFLLTLTDLSRLYLLIYLKEREVGKIRLGDAAEVSVDYESEHRFHGEVVYISPVAEFTPKNIQTKEERVKLVFGVKIALDNPQGYLKPGLPADALLKPYSSATE